MERERRALLRGFEKNKSYLATLLKMNFVRISKPTEASETFRKEGNILFREKPHNADTHKKIFNYYCRSITTAPNDSEQLAFAYGNRSAFLLHINRYEDCIKDCNRALEITDSETFKIKMLCRKVECLKKLRSSESQNVLKEAEICRDKIRDDDENKKSVTELINKVKALSVSKKSQIKNIVSIQSDEILDGIKIEHNQKYGRHLIATKDYKPGDIILVEKLFATTVNSRIGYINCHYCLKTCWSGVPCNECSWAIFCSKDCRDKAGKLFHDVECSLIPFLKQMDQVWQLYDICIRATLIGIRQAGSIDQLEADLKSIDDSTADACSKGFFKDGKHTKNKIESVYVLNSDRVPNSVLESMATCALMILIGIARYSQLITNINLHNIEEFIKKRDVIFLGSLIIKLLIVKSINDCKFAPNHMYACEESNNLSQCRQDSCCVRGSGFTPIASLVSHHCFPNTGRCVSEDRKVILYAVQLIKKNNQIFNSYSCEFEDKTIAERKLILQKYEIRCDCQACVESWPPILKMPEELLQKYGYTINSPFENKLYNDCIRIFDDLNRMSTHFNKKDVETLSKTIVQASKLKQPSQLMCFLVESLKRVFSHVYGLKLQLQSFGECH